MAKIIIGLLTVMLVASLGSGCYQAPAATPTPGPAPPPAEKVPAPVPTTPTETVPTPVPAPPPIEKTPAPAAFTTTNLTIFPSEVDAGKSVTISVRVTNTGDLAGSYNVILKTDNLAVATENVTLSGGASRTVTFTTTKDIAGTYTVNIDSLSGTFTVKTAPAPAGSTVYQVTIRDFSFSSNQITINVGDTVTWTNQGSVTHTVTGSSFDSNYLASGRSWSYTFKVAGTFTYRCALHPSMQGQVTVGSGSQGDGQNSGGSGSYSY